MHVPRLSEHLCIRFGLLAMSLILFIFSPYPLTAADSASEPVLQKVAIGYSGISGSQVPAWVAYEKGFFRKHGLDVQLIFVEGGSRAVKSLISGDIAAAQVGGSAVIKSHLQGSGVVIIAGFLNTMDYKLIVTREISRPDQLRGKVVAVSRKGSSSDFATRYALDKYGLQPDKDVTLVQIGGQPARFAALEAGKIDGVMLAVPLTLKAKKSGFNTLADLQMLGLEYQHTGLAVTEELIKSRPDLVSKILRAFVEAIHFYKTRRNESLEILAKYLKVDDVEALEETYEAIGLTLIPEKPYPTLKGIDVMLKEMADKDTKAKTAKPEQFVNLRFIKELDSSGFIDRLYQTTPPQVAPQKAKPALTLAKETPTQGPTIKSAKGNDQSDGKSTGIPLSTAQATPARNTAPTKTIPAEDKAKDVSDGEQLTKAGESQIDPKDKKQISPTVTTPTATPAPLVPQTQEYTIKSGDTLSKLSLRFYHTAFKWTKLYEANKENIKNPHYIFIGQKITIPPNDQTGT